MTTKPFVGALLTAAIAAALGYALYHAGVRHGQTLADTSAAPADGAQMNVQQGIDATLRHLRDGLKAGDLDPVTGRRILYYHDPMVPGKRFPAPGKSPFMDMMMVPVYAGGAYAGGTDTDDGSVGVDARTRQSLGLRTAPVVAGVLAAEVTAAGAIAYNERDQVIVQARASGHVEKLWLRAALDPVAAGQPLLELRVPDWVAAQEEFLAVRRMSGDNLAPLLAGARERMRQIGMDEAQIRLVENRDSVQSRFTLLAPIAGVVSELAVREGMTVAPGTTLVRINGLASVWAEAEVPESEAESARPDAQVSAESPAVPGIQFLGRVQTLVPQVNPATRTLRARVEFANPERRLVPGMFVQMHIATTDARASLLVPSEAIIATGRRTLVMRAEADGRFRPVAVTIGREAGGQTEIHSGLEIGEQVVVSGQFLIDSEASLRGLESDLAAAPEPGAATNTGDRP